MRRSGLLLFPLTMLCLILAGGLMGDGLRLAGILLSGISVAQAQQTSAPQQTNGSQQTGTPQQSNVPQQPVVQPATPATTPAATPAPAAQPAQSQSSPSVAKPTGIGADQARQTLDVLQNETKRNQLIQVLQAIANAPGVSTTPAATPAATTPAQAPAPAPALPVPLVADSLGAQLLEQSASWLDDAASAIGETVRSIADLPRIWSWLSHNLSDAKARAQLLDAIWRLVVVIGASVLAEYLLRMVLRRPLYLIERRAAYLHGLSALGHGASVDAAFEPDQVSDAAETTPSPIDPGSIGPDMGLPAASRSDDIDANEPMSAMGPEGIVPRDIAGLPKPAARWFLWLRRLPWIVSHFLITLAPIAIFAVVGNGLLGTDLADSHTLRLVGVAAVNAYVLMRAITSVVEMFVISRAPGLRLFPLRDETGAYIEIWSRRIAGTTLFGVAISEIALLLGMPRSGHDTLLKIVLLVVAIFAVIIILQSRHTVAQRLRARPGRTGVMAVALNRLAALWHIAAIFLVLAFWLVWAMEIRHGFVKLLNVCLIFLGILVAARLVTILLHAIFDRLFRIDDETEKRFPGLKQRANRYYPVLRAAISFTVAAFAIVILLQAWGLDAFDWFHGGEIGSRLLSAVTTVALAGVIACGVWEATNIAIDRHMMRLDDSGDYAHAARLRTLIPILKTILLVMMLIIIVMTILSEIGVNVAPLLAGASIVVVAIGFGSQKLVQDFITGIFLLLENAMQVGDSITASGLSGTVEKLSVRTIRLRAGDGAVHIIPFGAVGTVTNLNRGVGNAAIKVSVAATEDYDRVGEVLKSIAKEMRADENFRRMMRSDLQLWGIDEVQAGAITIAGQIVCSDSGRWGVQREFNRRLLKRFAELGIKIAGPAQYLVLAQEENARAAEIAEEGADRPGEAKTMRDAAGAGANREKTAAKEAAGKEDSATSLRNSPPPTALGHTE